MLDFFERFDVEKYGSEGGPLHDPNVIVYLLRPEFYEGKYVNVEIELGSDLTRGMTVVDWWNAVEPRPVTLIWALTYALSGRLTCEHFRESARLAGAPNDA